MQESVRQYLLRFVDLSQEELAAISGYLQIRHFGKREKLVGLGEKEVYINFVETGLIRKYFYRHNDEVITQIAKEGDLICSSVSFLSGDESMYTVETLEASTVISLSRNNLEKIYALGPRMERLGRLVTLDWLLKKEQWEHSRIKFGPKTRFLQFVSDNPNLLQRVPQKYLASYLNIKPETFSRYKHLIPSD